MRYQMWLINHVSYSSNIKQKITNFKFYKNVSTKKKLMKILTFYQSDY